MAPGIMKHTTKRPNMSFWSLENGYHDDFIGEEYPMRVLSSGHKNGLELILQSSIRDFDILCRGYLQGFFILTTTPGDSLYDADFFDIRFSVDLLYGITASVVSIPKSLFKYQPKKRECFFNSERQLRFFKAYTKKSCEDECVANFTIRECGCVKLSMPSIDICFQCL